ncbi:MAG: ATP-dependent sacrificial sulfur transferase LarE [Actinomycetota bacterium]
MRSTAELRDAVEERVRSYGDRAIVAHSGGVDSSLVLALAALALGTGSVTAVTALSPSYPEGELEEARRVAADVGVAHRVVRTREVEREAYVRNDEMRCYHCKAELYATLGAIAASADGAVVLAGAIADDLDDFRPGLWAGERAGVRNPLLEERVGKDAVRSLARELGLRVADKPALACLSSRVQTGLRITPKLLGRIDAAEREIRGLGFDVVRVRHEGGRARIEVAADQVERLERHPRLDRALAAIRHLGWATIEIEPAGYHRAVVP